MIIQKVQIVIKSWLYAGILFFSMVSVAYAQVQTSTRGWAIEAYGNDMGISGSCEVTQVRAMGIDWTGAVRFDINFVCTSRSGRGGSSGVQSVYCGDKLQREYRSTTFSAICIPQ